jgi:hypothetical protein
VVSLRALESFSFLKLARSELWSFECFHSQVQEQLRFMQEVAIGGVMAAA